MEDVHDELLDRSVDYEDYDNPYAYYHVLGLDYSLLVFNITLICLTITGNIYMIYFICGQKKARTTHNVTIVSIAAADVLIAACVQPIQLALYLNTSTEMQKAPFILCKMLRYLSFWFKSVIMYSTLGMVINRYWKFLHPRSPSFLTGTVMFYVNFVWFSGAAYNIWKLIVNDSRILPLYPQDGRNLSVRQCCANNVVDYFQTLRIGFLISDFLVVFVGPFVVVVFLFTRMIHHLCHRYNPTDKVKGSSRILTSVLFALLFFVCQFPYQVAETYYDHVEELREKDVTILRVVESISYMQGFLNVVACMAGSKEFHASWRLTVFGTPHPSNSSSSNTATHTLIRTNSCDNVIESICMS